MFALKRLMPAASVVTFLALAACSDATSPDNVSPTALEAGLSAATSTFENNAAFQSVAILTGANHFPQFAGAALAGATLPRVAGSRSQAAAARTSRILASLASNPQALFPANVLGKTLVWDTAGSFYVIGTATGAPANGVRITLYFVNPATELPFLPLQVLGYVDLVDKSTPQSDKLGVTLTLAQTPIADYDITVISGTTSGTARALGYFKSGTGAARVDFDLNDAVNLISQTLTSSNDLTADDGTVIHVVMTIGQTSDNVVASVSKDNATLELNASGDILGGTGPLSGTVKFNGVTVGNLGGTVDAPTITGVGGHTFTQAETASLLIIFGAAVEIVLGVSDGVFAPGTTVFHG